MESCWIANVLRTDIMNKFQSVQCDEQKLLSSAPKMQNKMHKERYRIYRMSFRIIYESNAESKYVHVDGKKLLIDWC